jgi:hypothetical protein
MSGTQCAMAAHPLVTEDTGTQGLGNAELEHGAAWTHDADTLSFAFQPQLSYGVLPTLDLIVQPSWLSSRSGTGGTSGFGDTAVDAKWRFYGSAPLSLAVRAGLLLPTSRQNSGMSGSAALHTTLVATLDVLPWTWHGNIGYTHNSSTAKVRRDTGHASAAGMYAVSERWIVTIDGSVDENNDPDRISWSGALLAGLIHTMRPGFDIDVGYQIGLDRSAGSVQWLLGATYRWAP